MRERDPTPRRDMSAYANGIAIRRGLAPADARAPLFNRRGGPDSTVIEHVQLFSSGRPPSLFAPTSLLPSFLYRAAHTPGYAMA